MKESILWNHLKPVLSTHGKFQKISDRFTPGIPDVLGCSLSRSYALELKELKGIRVIRTKFRPGQLDWLQDWHKAGGYSWILSTWGSMILVHPWEAGTLLEEGVDEDLLYNLSVCAFHKTRASTWGLFVDELLNLPREV